MMGVGMASTLRGGHPPGSGDQDWSVFRARGPALVVFRARGPALVVFRARGPGGLGAIRGEFLNPGIRAGVVSPTSHSGWGLVVRGPAPGWSLGV